ncbi:subtilisin-like protein [Gymnopus androsaceus JB14]|uniref:tripeptidyl-peptidase II n=1 Tax=Gymnopus androsaceus JB14 TaxID=1447944 RepID=A0A6A4GD52_9AGAR|nr:subtilisin-like protein [Gymnopus androsaceus JB14]
MSLSTPGSPEFRQWLSMEETVSGLFGLHICRMALEPTVISPNGDWVSITLPVSQANQLFATQFEVFTHPDMSDTITRTLSVSLPSEAGWTRRSPSSLDRRAVNPSCNSSLPSGVVTPTYLFLLVTAYEDQFAQRADLSEFLKLLRPDIPPRTTFTLLSIDGGINTQNLSDAGVEADLDIEYTTGLATNVPIEFLTVGGDDFGTSLLDTTTFLDGVAKPPSVMTTSYGDNEENFGSSMAVKICNGYMALGTRGISVVFASGDGGVRGGHDTLSVCANNTFMPVFPATCPFVTAIGSTQGFGPEKAINFTGGGFSNFFPLRPTRPLQSQASSRPSHLILQGSSQIWTAYPDASVQGWNFEIVSGGEVGLVGGTSASSPTFASIIALINDRLIAAGKPVLGFLNPFIYSTASTAFTDITIGHNSGFVCPASSVAFDAAVGWDALTGFGTPIFSKILAAAMA